MTVLRQFHVRYLFPRAFEVGVMAIASLQSATMHVIFSPLREQARAETLNLRSVLCNSVQLLVEDSLLLLLQVLLNKGSLLPCLDPRSLRSLCVLLLLFPSCRVHHPPLLLQSVLQAPIVGTHPRPEPRAYSLEKRSVQSVQLANWNFVMIGNLLSGDCLMQRGSSVFSGMLGFAVVFLFHSVYSTLPLIGCVATVAFSAWKTICAEAVTDWGAAFPRFLAQNQGCSQERFLHLGLLFQDSLVAELQF